MNLQKHNVENIELIHFYDVMVEGLPESAWPKMDKFCLPNFSVTFQI